MDRYIFDKRDWKRRFIKYGIIFGISFLPIVLFNIYCSKYFEKRWLLIFVDSVMLLVFVMIGGAIANKIFEKKDRALEKKQKEREALKLQKRKIMEDSYKKIRAEKTTKKASQQKTKDEIVIEVVEDNKGSNTPEDKPTTKQVKPTNTKTNKNTKGRK